MSNIKETPTTRQLQSIFHTHLLLMDLHLYNTRDKMMGMLRREGNPNWTTEQILSLANNKEIPWVKGASDPTDYNTYIKSMNTRLAEILRTN
jgi:hypothetical protein